MSIGEGPDIKETPAPAAALTGEVKDDLMSPMSFRIGYDKADDPDVMIFNVPLKRCADDLEEGSAVLRGKLEEAKQIALKIIAAKRERKKINGLVRPPIGGSGLRAVN